MATTLEQEILAGTRVAALLADEHIIGVFASLETQYVAQIKSSPAGSPQLADAVAGIRAIEAVRTSLAAVVDSGKLATAKARVEADRTARERAKRQ